MTKLSYTIRDPELQKLRLVAKQSLKFLDAFGLSSQDHLVGFRRHSHQVSDSIIILDSIEMMDKPANRQRFTMMFFPNQSVFANFAGDKRPRVGRKVYSGIALAVLAACPRSPFAFMRQMQVAACCAPAPLARNPFAALAAPRGVVVSPLELRVAPPATTRPWVNQRTAVRARVTISQSPSPDTIHFICVSHITIVPYGGEYV